MPRKKGEYEANLTYGWPRFARSLSSHELLQPPFLNMGEGTGTHIGISEHAIIRHIRNLRVNRTQPVACDSHIGRESSELFTKYERIMLDNGQKIAGGLPNAIAGSRPGTPCCAINAHNVLISCKKDFRAFIVNKVRLSPSPLCRAKVARKGIHEPQY